MWHSCDLGPDFNSRVGSRGCRDGEGGLFAASRRRRIFASKSRLRLRENARRPRGDTTSRHHVEVPGALLDGCWLYAASVLFCYRLKYKPIDLTSNPLAHIPWFPASISSRFYAPGLIFKKIVCLSCDTL